MSAIYRTLKTSYRQVAPDFAHEYIFGGKSLLSKAILRVKLALESRSDHDDIYDAAYYGHYTEEMQHSAIGIVDSIQEAFSPKDAVDIGCGSGEILNRLGECGIIAQGSDLSTAALEACRSKGLTVTRLDLEDHSQIPSWNADVVISLEVAEHLPEASADHYVNLLARMARKAVVMTAAPPGQGGTDHVNERPYGYWMQKMDRAGAYLCPKLTDKFRRDWAARGVEESRARNVMVFLKS